MLNYYDSWEKILKKLMYTQLQIDYLPNFLFGFWQNHTQILIIIIYRTEVYYMSSIVTHHLSALTLKISSSQEIIYISQLAQPSHREVRWLTKGHTTGRWWKQNLTPSRMAHTHNTMSDCLVIAENHSPALSVCSQVTRAENQKPYFALGQTSGERPLHEIWR